MEKRMDETMDAEKFLKELIRRALLGDQEAQKKCTEKGIVLPCPFCGGKAMMQQDITGRESYHVACSNVKDMCNLIAGLPMWSESEEDALKVWNTRPAPPIGRCGECALWKEEKECPGAFCCTITGMERESNDFCSEVEPKEK